ncbi:hypothetical protein LTS13_008568 [Exophiala xenobiotica]|nr:hypothetical protein LTR41_010507 [Exophiala xenobiotica]KAK5340984.1 hypothetical protein LTR98_001776 [Exophiala xenobiotica]KAK5365914.1 hypothetical protein LTS13_008568 [Exophiala xenobiotica]KAK5425518.1 hypothetical protein LTR34_011036 [Exophiala xenobiotica]KAK5543045.1 hypothetical protein LTR23_005086 [Chaetothyriales sp. CCFEE 6169]
MTGMRCQGILQLKVWLTRITTLRKESVLIRADVGRTRHIKCDESRPSCQRCIKGGRQCGYGSIDKAQKHPQGEPKIIHYVVKVPKSPSSFPLGTSAVKKSLYLSRGCTSAESTDCTAASNSKPQIPSEAQDDSSEGTTPASSATVWLLHGDPRPLPFSSIPIKTTGSVTIAYEFFKHVWIPVKQQSLTSSASTVFRARCQVMLRDEMLFEQVMAYSLLMQNMDKAPRQRMTPSILNHSNRSLMRLRQRLQSPSLDVCLSDAVIQTIVLLIALHHTCADFEPVSFHLQALHQLINLSVGKRKLEWNEFVEHEVNLLDINWNTAVTTYQPVQKREQASLEYPDYPFSSAICHRIARFQPGFCKLALRRKLSLQFMHVLEGVLDMAHDRDMSKNALPAYGTIDDLITNPGLSVLERVLAVALLVCWSSAARAQEEIPPIVAFSIQAHARSFPPGRTISGDDSMEEKALDWAALALHYNTKEGSIAWTWANKRIHHMSEDHLAGSYQYQLQESFLLFTPGRDIV